MMADRLYSKISSQKANSHLQVLYKDTRRLKLHFGGEGKGRETGPHPVTQDVLKLSILQSQIPKLWDYRCVSLCPAPILFL